MMIYMTGFMGAGKTTIGAALGKKMQLPVYDTDQLIETECQATVRELFRRRGERFFRRCETAVLKKLSVHRETAVITTGGGIMTNPENQIVMKQSGIVFFLYCDLETIRQRLAADSSRPLLQKNPGRRLNELYARRLPDYLKATATVNTTGKPIALIVDEILSIMYQIPQKRAS